MNRKIVGTLEECCKDEASLKKLKRLFEDLYQSKTRYRNLLRLLESSIRDDYDSILITELNLEQPGPKIVYVNEGFSKMTGYSRAEVIGKTPRILQGPKTSRAVLDKLKKNLSNGKSFFGCTVNYRKDGTEFINQWDIHPLTNDLGDVTHWVSYQHDVTDRKRMESKLIDLQVEFDDLREESMNAFVDVDPEGAILSINNVFKKLVGYGSEELVEYKIWTLFNGENKEDIKHYFQSSERSGKSLDGCEFQLSTQEGKEIEVCIHPRIITFEGRKVIRFLFENRTVQKKIIQKLKEKNADFNRIFGNIAGFT